MSNGADLSEFEVAQSSLRRSGYANWYERVTPQLDEERKASLDAALGSPHITARAISNVLKAWGHEVSMSSVSEVRRKLYG